MCSPPTERPRSLMRFSRGFKERTPALAVKHGHKHILPDYPAHVLFDELYMALSAAGTGGDIPAIELLWQLAGPTSPGRLAWAEEIGLISEAMIHGHIPVLDWIADAVSATGIPINWKSQSMGSASVAGRTDAIHWAIVHKRIRNLPYWAAMLSTRENDVSVMDWWIAKQPDNDMAIWEMGSTMTLSAATSAGAVRALDWWWAYTGPQTLPDPQSFADIVDAALISVSLVVVEWWRTRFLEHRTPRHKFGGKLEIGLLHNVEILEWCWCRYNEAPDCFSRPFGPDDNPHGLFFSNQHGTTIPILQWAVEKCATSNGQRLQLPGPLLEECAHFN